MAASATLSACRRLNRRSGMQQKEQSKNRRPPRSRLDTARGQSFFRASSLQRRIILCQYPFLRPHSVRSACKGGSPRRAPCGTRQARTPLIRCSQLTGRSGAAALGMLPEPPTISDTFKRWDSSTPRNIRKAMCKRTRWRIADQTSTRSRNGRDARGRSPKMNRKKSGLNPSEYIALNSKRGIWRSHFSFGRV